jgi:hypothetical protein
MKYILYEQKYAKRSKEVRSWICTWNGVLTLCSVGYTASRTGPSVATMAAVVEWKDQTKSNQPFIFGVGSKFSASALKREYISTLLKQEIKGRLVFSDPSTGNPKIRNEADIAGSIVVITRGGNSFAYKYANAACLGAALVIFANVNDSAPNSVFACTGDISKCGFELPEFGTSFPPCITISLAAYRRLRLETPFMLTVNPLQSSHLSLLQTYDFGPALRSAVMLGKDVMVRELLKELDTRDSAAVVPASNSDGVAAAAAGPGEAACSTTNSSVKSTANRWQAALDDGEIGRGATTCHVAVECRQPACLSLLLKSGANTEVVKSDGCTALHLAAMRNDIECLPLLIDGAAYIDHPHLTGWTAMHLACKHGAFDALQILIEAGGDVNARANDGASALHVACLFGMENAVSQLIRAGADASLETTEGMTASTFALYCGYPNCVAIIEKYAQIGKVRRKSEMRKASFVQNSPTDSSVEAPQDAVDVDDNDPVWNTFSNPSRDENAKPRRGSGGTGGSGGGLLDEEIQMEDVFSGSSSGNGKFV